MKLRLLYSLSFFVFGMVLLNSCFTTKYNSEKTNTFVIYPAPPDTARIQYLTSFSSSNIVSREQSKFLKSILGEEKAKFISKPFGIEINNS